MRPATAAPNLPFVIYRYAGARMSARAITAAVRPGGAMSTSFPD
jgi:hypothetical protein